MDLTVFKEHLKSVRKLSREHSGIAIHAVLEHVFAEGIAAQPKTIVELGVSREALANKVLAMVAEMNDASFWSCDLSDFSWVCRYSKWYFWKGHDVEFASEFGPPYRHGKVDLLFIDTDELYGHVCEEIRAWFPLLNPNATVMFRCTNLQKRLFYEDGSSTFKGWNNDKGVIRAINDILSVHFDETRPFDGRIGQWKIRHWPWGAGLTVMTKQ